MRFFTLIALICSVLMAVHHYRTILNATEWDPAKDRKHLNSLILHIVFATTCGWLVLGGL